MHINRYEKRINVNTYTYTLNEFDQQRQQCRKSITKESGIKQILTSSFGIDSNERKSEKKRKKNKEKVRVYRKNQSVAFIFNCCCCCGAFSTNILCIVFFPLVSLFSACFFFLSLRASQLHMSSRLHCCVIFLSLIFLFFHQQPLSFCLVVRIFNSFLTAVLLVSFSQSTLSFSFFPKRFDFVLLFVVDLSSLVHFII